MKNKRKNNIFFVLILFILVPITLFAVYKINNNPHKIEVEYKDNDILEINPIDTIYLENLNIGNITCTGLTYDEINNSFWIADYGAINSNVSPKPRLIEVNDKFDKVLSVIELNKLNVDGINLQGISYNNDNNSIFIATGNYIVELSKEGNIINKIENDFIKKYKSNGLSYNKNDGTLWTLMYSKYLTQLNTNGDFIEKIVFNYKDQDQIYIENDYLYITIGSDYNSNNNFILTYNLKNSSKKVYRAKESYAIEGIVVLNNKIYVANDGLFHDAKIKKNYINIYDFS